MDAPLLCLLLASESGAGRSQGIFKHVIAVEIVISIALFFAVKCRVNVDRVLDLLDPVHLSDVDYISRRPVELTHRDVL